MADIDDLTLSFTHTFDFIFNPESCGSGYKDSAIGRVFFKITQYKLGL